MAGLYEWGGDDANGSWGFSTTWSLPIHQLMAANHVTIFFQRHDHIWVRPQMDGVTYQTLSEPADPNYSWFNSDAYLSGDKFPNTGYWGDLYIRSGARLVSNDPQAFLESPILDFWAGLDDSLSIGIMHPISSNAAIP